MVSLFLQVQVQPTGRRNFMLFVEQFWPILIAAALGLAAIYLLLPRVRRYPGLYGGLAGVLALVLVGWWLLQPEPIWVETVLFYIFAGMAVLAGGVMITQTQPVYAALSFALVVLSTCGLFLLQAAPFLMAATIIIYAGAIVVTFLFVIMLAQQCGLDSADYRSREPLLACIAGFVLLVALLCVLHRDYAILPGNEDKLARINQYLIEELNDPDVKPVASSAGLIARIDGHLQKIDQAAQAPSDEELRDILEDSDFLHDFKHLVKPLQGPEGRPNYKNQLASNLTNIGAAVLDMDDPDDPDANAKEVAVSLRKLLAESYALGWRLQNELRGNLQPDPTLPLSHFSGVPPNQVPPRDAHGRATMPADNVAAIGKSLFTDYLIAVELAATLLLVATIGAIVITARRTGGLR